MICAAGIVNPATNASDIDIIIFAEKPAATPAYAANIPVNGCLPIPKYINAANGGNTTNPASATQFAIIPTNIIVAVTSFDGILSANDFNKDSIIPTFSASPAPSIVTKTNPSGAKAVKLVTILFKNSCICSFDNKFTADTVSPVPG